MDYTLTHYKQNRDIIYRTSGGQKYLISKSKRNQVYMKCSCFVEGANLLLNSVKTKNLICVVSNYNHGVELYNKDVYLMKNKCKEAAKSSGTNLCTIVNDVTRNDPKGRTITFAKCKSLMYRARR